MPCVSIHLAGAIKDMASLDLEEEKEKYINTNTIK